MNPLLARVAGAPADALAVIDGELCWTYGSLRAEVAGLAAALRAAGVASGDVVSLRVGRCARHVAGMLACWSLDASFVPLDPEQPASWSSDAEAMVGARARVDATGVVPLGQAPRLLPEPAAYVIFTSGSSGRPKAVQVPHRGLAPLWSAQAAAFLARSGDRIAWGLSVAFDASVSDIGVALWVGGTVVVVPPGRWWETLRAHQVAVADVPPSLLPRVRPADLPETLRTLVIGGEVCPAAVVRAHAAARRVVNVYGPTEATVCASLAVCAPDAGDAAVIGAPLPGWQFRAVDGELWIAGVGVATGYLDEPSLTRDRFVIDDGVRWYRTGDHAWVRPDGAWVFGGRRDRQVKVRGQLVEPEGVEAALREIPGVTEAAVTVTRTPTARGERVTLVAHVAGEVSIAELRAHLAARLPAWCRPSRIVRHTELPRGVSGKVRADALSAAREPDPRERRICEVFARALGVESVDPDADFFELGGDSLAILDAVAIAEADGCALTPEVIAEHRTAAAIAVAPASDARPAAWLRACAEATWRRRRDQRERGYQLISRVFRPARLASGPRCLLVTGGTGSLGGSLIPALLSQTAAQIVLLVRAPDDAAAARRVPAHPRIRALAGDVSAPDFGWDRARWGRWARRVDAVVHAAASVNHVAGWEALASANVDGTAEVVRFAHAGRHKHLHLVSTLSVFVATDRNTGIALEDDDVSSVAWVWGGYAQSKYAAEWLVRGASRGRAASIHRLGLVTAGADGRPARGDFLATFVRGVVASGAVPAGVDPRLAIDRSAADAACAALGDLVGSAGRRSGVHTYHIAAADPIRVVDLLDAIASATGLPRVPVEAWAPGPGASAAASLAACRLRGGDAFARLRGIDLFQATDIRFDDRHARAALGRAPIPPADSGWLTRFVRHALEAP